MTKKLSVRELPLNGKRVLMRVDFNVPLDKEGRIADETRIISSLPTIDYILSHGASLVLMSHLGRPKGKRAAEYSLKPVAELLSNRLGHEVVMAPDCIGPEVGALVDHLSPGRAMLLENLRFHRAEEHPEEDPSFARQLAGWGDIYVDDAFGAAHRSHSSTVEITRYFPGRAAAGFLLEKEIQFLGDSLLNPARPFYALIGGAKISTKIGVMRSLLSKVDCLLIGGGMAYTFFKAQGIAIGGSLCEETLLSEARQILELAKEKGVELLLPVDNVVADRIADDAAIQITSTAEGIPPGKIGVDIGPRTIELFSSKLQSAKTVLWNGPLGVFEVEQFSKGTTAIAHALAGLDAITIVGGGDSISALQKAGCADRVSHLSTGGGASLEYIEFGKLPAIEALTEGESQGSL